MKRTKIKGNAKHKKDPETEPNFYVMRPISSAPLPVSPPSYTQYPYYPYAPPYTAAQQSQPTQPPPHLAMPYPYPPYPYPPYYGYWPYPPVAPPPPPPPTTTGQRGIHDSNGGRDRSPPRSPTSSKQPSSATESSSPKSPPLSPCRKTATIAVATHQNLIPQSPVKINITSQTITTPPSKMSRALTTPNNEERRSLRKEGGAESNIANDNNDDDNTYDDIMYEHGRHSPPATPLAPATPTFHSPTASPFKNIIVTANSEELQLSPATLNRA
eukprot:CAMPEP_0202477646 /NCGR_PEP_ID=MMETSP1360-20130828/94048_1 /ASSEMBLY_ACC=CAM_ASM_000848 /TAXON_ID=515479 /ORGANISM="Licmophora paradoxa, Strain CCMP2313" /LENGTH=270 /DNA_ID=CAMNT_0049104895 /DNA_START=18 /DNA_END=830 /DNA_ORIENTATION=-